ncbi:MerR family transcriptional regulator [Bacillus massilinigeriensis]|uniref:hypothetical protein n=1 Tax=Bacillus massilionigeriensis TaxID=1805475 RepID=UPI00096B25E4|nr:hypothetical protein [Bacillus massilionigeriensis]
MNTEYKGNEYATKDIARIVGIATPTVRKYAQALEKAGYSFIKNNKGFRIFIENDITIFYEIKNLSNNHAIPIDRIAEMIVSDQQEPDSVSDTVPYRLEYSELVEKLNKVDMINDIMIELEEVKQVNRLLLDHVKQLQESFVNTSINDRDKKLVDSMKLSMENRQIKGQLEEIKNALLEISSGKQKKRIFGR